MPDSFVGVETDWEAMDVHYDYFSSGSGEKFFDFSQNGDEASYSEDVVVYPKSKKEKL